MSDVQQLLNQAKHELTLGNYYNSFKILADFYNESGNNEIYTFLCNTFLEPNRAEMNRIFTINAEAFKKYPLIITKNFISLDSNNLTIFPVDGCSAFIYNKNQDVFKEIGINNPTSISTPSDNLFLENEYNEAALLNYAKLASEDSPSYFYYTNTNTFAALMGIIDFTPMLSSQSVVFLFEKEKEVFLRKKTTLLADYFTTALIPEGDYIKRKLHNHRIITMNGGLGNQVFQYIFGRCMQLSTNSPVIFEDYAFHIDNFEHNGYELEKIWGLKPNLLSTYLGASAFNELMSETKESRLPIEAVLKRHINDMTIIREFDEYPLDTPWVLTPHNIYTPEIFTANGTIFYRGYWINRGYFEKISDILYKELAFPPLIDRNKPYAKLIVQSASVSIHIRRGDFLKLNLSLSMNFYANAVSALRTYKPDEQKYFFIFSDDIAWCKENLSEIGLTQDDTIYYVEGNTKEHAYMDMQLMSLSKYMIIANSSFSYLALLLNRRVESFVNPLPYRDEVRKL